MLFMMITSRPKLLPGQEAWGKPISIGISLFETIRSPATRLAQIGFCDAPELTSCIVRLPSISEPALMENVDHPWIPTFPVTFAWESMKSPPRTVTFPRTPPPTNMQIWSAETAMSPSKKPS